MTLSFTCHIYFFVIFKFHYAPFLIKNVIFENTIFSIRSVQLKKGSICMPILFYLLKIVKLDHLLWDKVHLWESWLFAVFQYILYIFFRINKHAIFLHTNFPLATNKNFKVKEFLSNCKLKRSVMFLQGHSFRDCNVHVV